MEHTPQAPYIDLPAFQGPLDLLLHLIRQHKIDIYDIPIALLADQFIAAIRQMEQLDIEVASEFLVLAAQLLYMKSRQLLPRHAFDEEDEEEDRFKQDLVDRLVTYRAIKEAAYFLRQTEGTAGIRYFRTVNPEEIVAGLTPKDPLVRVEFSDILTAFRRVLERAERGEETDVRFLELEEISIELIINDVLRRLLLYPKAIFFGDLLRYKTRVELVMAFLALLELLKEGKVRADQGQSDIFLVPTAKAWEFAEEE